MKRCSTKGAPPFSLRFRLEYQTSEGGYAATETNEALWLSPDECDEVLNMAVARMKRCIAEYRTLRVRAEKEKEGHHAC